MDHWHDTPRTSLKGKIASFLMSVVSTFVSMTETNNLSVSRSDLLFLTKVTYNEDRKEVLVEFSSKLKKLIERFKLFPFLALPKNTDLPKVKQLLLDLGIRSFNISEKDNYLSVQASSFSNLKIIANSLANVLGNLPLVITPERQFLLEKNWTYFDSFMQFNGSLIKVDSFKKDVSFAVAPEIPFSEVMRLDKEQALFLVEQAALSSVLTIPLNCIPKSVQEREEIFLQNLFFKNAGYISWETNTKVQKSKNRVPFVFDKVSSIDFSPVWVQLFSKQFFNVGSETKNCSCCKPFTLEDKNLLPSSLIEVIINEDNVFFESSSPSFAAEFNEEHSGKEFREKKQKEFFLTSIPLGPFNNNDKVCIPLLDAKKLIENNFAVLGKTHAPDWFCLKKESFFSFEISKLSTRMSELSKVIEEPQTTLFDSKDFGFLFANNSLSILSVLIAELPFQLMNLSSSFYSPSLSKSILSIQEATLFKFKEFSKEQGYRVLHSDKRSTLIRGHSPLSLAKKFSKELSFPQPVVSSFAVRARF